jgi:hypothetical protein
MIKYTMNDCDFRDMMNSEGSDYANQFSYEGLGLLFEHLNELDEDYEFDKIGICCDWTEYKSIEAAKKEYRVGVDGDLEDNTIVLKDDGGIVVVLNF